MKNLILSFILLLSCINLTFSGGGIDIDIQTSETPYKWGGKNGNTFEYIIGETADEYLALRATVFFFSYDYKIARYDKSSMNLLEVKPLFPKDYIKKGVFKPSHSWGISIYKDKIYALFGATDQLKDIVTIYYQQLNQDGSMDGSPTQLQEIVLSKGFQTGKLDCIYSYDSSKFLSVYEIPTKNKENQKYIFQVYNIENMQVVFNREVELPFMDKDVNLIRYDVDNEGNVYGLVKIVEKREKGNKDPDHFTYKIYGFSAESDDMAEYDFDIERYINSITFRVRKGVVYCSGFWGRKNVNDISGVYSIRLNAETGEEIAQDVYEFSDEFIAEFYTEKQVERAEKKGKELDVAKIVLDYFKVQDDGSAILIGEQFYTYEVCYYSNGRYTCRTYYVYNDIIVTKIDQRGVILWSSKIPKKSVSSGGVAHLSYHFHQKGDDIYFIYYDHQDNFNEVDPRKFDRVPAVFSKKLDLVCTKINGNGEKEKSLLFNYGDQTRNNLRITPINLQNLNANEFIGQGFVKGNKEVLVRFSVR